MRINQMSKGSYEAPLRCMRDKKSGIDAKTKKP